MFDLYVSDNWDEQVKELLESFEEDPERKAHLEALSDAFFDFLQRDNSEYGGWGIDSKRPFGNSYVEGDIADIIGIDMPKYETDEYDEACAYLGGLYSDLGVFLRYKWLSLKEAK